jgi:hypothetical protein
MAVSSVFKLRLLPFWKLDQGNHNLVESLWENLLGSYKFKVDLEYYITVVIFHFPSTEFYAVVQENKYQ